MQTHNILNVAEPSFCTYLSWFQKISPQSGFGPIKDYISETAQDTR